MQIPSEAREPPDLPELELQEVVKHPVWVLRTELRSLRRAVYVCTTELPLHAVLLFLQMKRHNI